MLRSRPAMRQRPTPGAAGLCGIGHAAALGLRPSRIPQPSSLPESCRAVSERAAQAIKIGELNNWLLDIALDRLTLGRAALYAAVLEGHTA
jgi:hypothetical protein